MARMQEAKARKRKGDSEEGPVENLIASTCSGASSHSILDARKDEEMIERTARIQAQTDPAEARNEYYMQWINSLHRDDIQILAMMLYDNYIETFGLQKTTAAEQVALRLGLCDKTIRGWRKTFLNNSGRFNPDGRGKYPRNKPINNQP